MRTTPGQSLLGGPHLFLLPCWTNRQPIPDNPAHPQPKTLVRIFLLPHRVRRLRTVRVIAVSRGGPHACGGVEPGSPSETVSSFALVVTHRAWKDPVCCRHSTYAHPCGEVFGSSRSMRPRVTASKNNCFSGDLSHRRCTTAQTPAYRLNSEGLGGGRDVNPPSNRKQSI